MTTKKETHGDGKALATSTKRKPSSSILAQCRVQAADAASDGVRSRWQCERAPCSVSRHQSTSSTCTARQSRQTADSRRLAGRNRRHRALAACLAGSGRASSAAGCSVAVNVSFVIYDDRVSHFQRADRRIFKRVDVSLVSMTATLHPENSADETGWKDKRRQEGKTQTVNEQPSKLCDQSPRTWAFDAISSSEKHASPCAAPSLSRDVMSRRRTWTSCLSVFRRMERRMSGQH